MDAAEAEDAQEEAEAVRAEAEAQPAGKILYIHTSRLNCGVYFKKHNGSMRFALSRFFPFGFVTLTYVN